MPSIDLKPGDVYTVYTKSKKEAILCRLKKENLEKSGIQ